MSDQWPPYSGGYQEDASAYTYQRRGVNRWGILAIGVFAVMSFYSTLAVATRLDHIYRPGNELNFGFVTQVGPIVDAPEDKPAAETIEERINILFLGLDRRIDEPEDEPYRTDSVMVLTIDPYSKTAGALSIPRDTVVEIRDADGEYYTEGRINEVYEYGEYPSELNVPGLAGYPGGGAGLIMDTIDSNFGIQIDHYMVMDWVDFMDIINELGGVDINVPEYAYDPAYADCSFCDDVYSVEFVPGPEHMDGTRALAYARIRKSDNDFKRIERQQLVLKAMAAKAANVGTILDNPIGLYDKFNDAVKSDVSPGRAGALGLLYRDIQKKATEQGLEPIRTISMAPATFPCATCNYAGLNYDPVLAQELIAQVFSDARVVQESASVEVLNATPTPDLAATFADYMQSKGIAPDKISTDEYADGLIYPETYVIDRTGSHDQTLSQLEEWLALPEGRVVVVSDPQATPFLDSLPSTVLDSLSDVVILLGEDAQIDWTTGQVGVSLAPAQGGG